MCGASAPVTKYYHLVRRGAPWSVTTCHIAHGYGAVMDDRRVQLLIDRAIRAHELRVALWSGLLGLLLMAGTWHAIWMCR